MVKIWKIDFSHTEQFEDWKEASMRQLNEWMDGGFDNLSWSVYLFL